MMTKINIHVTVSDMGEVIAELNRKIGGCRGWLAKHLDEIKKLDIERAAIQAKIDWQRDLASQYEAALEILKCANEDNGEV